MRKSIKTIATTVAVAAMSMGLAVSAFAAEDNSDYSVVGAEQLGIAWEPASAICYVEDNGDGTFSKKLTATDAGDLEFKIVKDGTLFEWTYQLQLGMTEFIDNASQFKLPGTVAGDEFVVTFNPTTGDVDVDKNGEDFEYLVRWASRAEDPTDFLTKKEALALYVGVTEEEEPELVEDDAAYSVVGAEQLGIAWDPTADFCFVANNGDGSYSKKLVATEDGDFEFKILEDGPTFSWANQLQLGTGLFADNASQFKLTGVVTGDEFVVTFVPATGDVVVEKDGEEVEYLVRWGTRAEDPEDFLTKEEALEAFVNTEDDTEEPTEDDTEEPTKDNTEEPTKDNTDVPVAKPDENCANYSVVGAEQLSIAWDPAADFCFVKDNGDGTYSKTLVATADGDFEFKILEDGPTFSWSNQMQLGTGLFADNASQFKLENVLAGEVYVVTFNPSTGDVVVTMNDEEVEYLVRWATREEDPQDFLTKKEALAKFVEPKKPSDEKPSDEKPSGEKPSGEKPSGEKPSDEKPSDEKPSEGTTTTAATQGPKTGDAVPVAVVFALVAAVAVAFTAKKKAA